MKLKVIKLKFNLQAYFHIVHVWVRCIHSLKLGSIQLVHKYNKLLFIQSFIHSSI